MNKLYFTVSRLALGCIMASVLTAFGTLYMCSERVSVPLASVFLFSLASALAGYFLIYIFTKLFGSALKQEKKKGITTFFFYRLIPLLCAALMTYGLFHLPDSFFTLFIPENAEAFAVRSLSYNYSLCTQFFVSLVCGMMFRREDADGYYAEPITVAVSGAFIGICYAYKAVSDFFAGMPESTPHGAYSVLLLVSVVSYAVISSQACVADIRGGIGDNTANKSDTQALLYNYVMLVFMIPMWAAVLAMSWLTLNALAVIVRFAVYLAAKPYGMQVIGVGARGAVDIFSVVFLAAETAALLSRAHLSGVFASVSQSVMRLISELVSAILRRLKRIKSGQTSRSSAESTEEETKYQDALINEYVFDEAPVLGRDTFDSFLRRLQKIREPDAQIGFAYRKMCEMYRAGGVSIKMSDTPREVAGKLTGVSYNERESVVRMIERVKFSGDTLSDEEKEEILTQLCRIIRRQYI